MFKKTLSVLIFICACTLVFAQTAPKKVLSVKDIDGFIKNYAAMDSEFTALGNMYENLIEPGTEEETLGSAITRARTTKAPPEIQAIIKKYGFGDNGFEKIMVITFGCSALEMDRAMDEQTAGIEMTPEMKGYLDTAKAQIAEMKAAFDPADLKLIQSKQDEIITLLTLTGE